MNRKQIANGNIFAKKMAAFKKLSFFMEELGSTISKLKFDNNGKITSYYTQGTSAEVIPYITKIQYDDKDRVAKINDVNSSNEQTDNYKISIMLTAGILHFF